MLFSGGLNLLVLKSHRKSNNYVWVLSGVKIVKVVKLVTLVNLVKLMKIVIP